MLKIKKIIIIYLEKNLLEKNKDNIELDINGEESKLINEYKLRKGENKIKMKKKIKLEIYNICSIDCCTQSLTFFCISGVITSFFFL